MSGRIPTNYESSYPYGYPAQYQDNRAAFYVDPTRPFSAQGPLLLSTTTIIEEHLALLSAEQQDEGIKKLPSFNDLLRSSQDSDIPFKTLPIPTQSINTGFGRYTSPVSNHVAPSPQQPYVPSYSMNPPPTPAISAVVLDDSINGRAAPRSTPVAAVHHPVQGPNRPFHSTPAPSRNTTNQGVKRPSDNIISTPPEKRSKPTPNQNRYNVIQYLEYVPNQVNEQGNSIARFIDPSINPSSIQTGYKFAKNPKTQNPLCSRFTLD